MAIAKGNHHTAASNTTCRFVMDLTEHMARAVRTALVERRQLIHGCLFYNRGIV